MKILVVGATGVIGRRLVPLLVAGGHEVTGTTRSADKKDMLKQLGAKAAVVDVFDAAALASVVSAAKPDVVIHQLTDLPDTIVPEQMPAFLSRNARLRIEGTRNLMDAAHVAGVRRVVAQSLAFVYAPGAEPRREEDALDGRSEAAVTVGGVKGLETAVLGTPPIEGIVLRYGRLYGPDTWSLKAEPPALHVDAAAQAALLAVTRGAPGIYNIADDDGAVSIAKAQAQLDFDPAFRVPETA